MSARSRRTPRGWSTTFAPGAKRLCRDVTTWWRRSHDSGCGHVEPRTWKSEARHQRQFALGVGPQRQRRKVDGGPNPHEARSRAEFLHAGLLREARRLRRAENGAVEEARRDHRDGEGVWLARSRRRRLSDRNEVAVRRQEDRAPLYRLQRR